MITKHTEWEGEQTRLVRLGGLARSVAFPRGSDTRSKYYEIPRRKIGKIIVHHSAGPRKHGIDAPAGIAKWVSRPKKYNSDGKRVGGGRGWPGMPYTFVIPTTLEIVDGKYEVYRCWEDSWRTWHTGPGHNDDGVAVCMAGWFASRHWGSDNAVLSPDAVAVEALEELVLRYLLPRYGITKNDIFGHFDFGKKMCPGDYLEEWVRNIRGEKWKSPLLHTVQPTDKRALNSSRDRQRALVDLGYDLGKFGPDGNGVDGIWGFASRAALEAFQEDTETLIVDGYWGPNTEKAIRVALALRCESSS